MTHNNIQYVNVTHDSGPELSPNRLKITRIRIAYTSNKTLRQFLMQNVRFQQISGAARFNLYRTKVTFAVTQVKV
jgi:hypothetical protein